ncbi:MAG: aminomethyl-transferring glycine dehydrogenase subunit GcvPA [Micavibrio sp.]
MRYLPQTQKSREAMLDAVGVKTVRDLYRDVPEKAFIKGLAKIPLHSGEMDVERQLSGYANENHAAGAGPFFLGAGCYNHHIPASVDYIIQRSEFLTAYTPYQPEIAQGTLTAIYEFQTFIAQLTGQDVANASMYDGATACVEAALMAMRITGRKKLVIGNALHPHYRDVVDTYMKNHPDVEIVSGDPDDSSACVILQSPDFFGAPHAYEDWRAKCDATGALLVVVINEIVSLGLLPAPSMADIVCGEAQSVGLPMSFGGPHLGFFACREQYIRQMPGRLVGQTLDADGKVGFVLTLSTREQHIRREKATSNICTNQGLCALAFTVHMALLGENGFRRLATLNHERACDLADALGKVKGVSVENQTFFNEFVVTLPVDAQKLVESLAEDGIIAGHPLGGNRLLMAATEMTTDDDIETLIGTMKEAMA